jgi:hypothetical protein
MYKGGLSRSDSKFFEAASRMRKYFYLSLKVVYE